MQHERRQHARTVVACPVRVFDRQGRMILKGKTVDISSGGVKVMGPMRQEPAAGSEVDVEVDLRMPDHGRHGRPQTVRRTATIRRVDLLGDWTAVALEFAKAVDME